jgi:hypothetical protein
VRMLWNLNPGRTHELLCVGTLWESQHAAPPTQVERESTNLARCSRSRDIIIAWLSRCTGLSLFASSLFRVSCLSKKNDRMREVLVPSSLWWLVESDACSQSRRTNDEGLLHLNAAAHASSNRFGGVRQLISIFSRDESTCLHHAPRHRSSVGSRSFAVEDPSFPTYEPSNALPRLNPWSPWDKEAMDCPAWHQLSTGRTSDKCLQRGS